MARNLNAQNIIINYVYTYITFCITSQLQYFFFDSYIITDKPSLHYSTLHYTKLHFTALHYNTLHYTKLKCTLLH